MRKHRQKSFVENDLQRKLGKFTSTKLNTVSVHLVQILHKSDGIDGIFMQMLWEILVVSFFAIASLKHPRLIKN